MELVGGGSVINGATPSNLVPDSLLESGGIPVLHDCIGGSGWDLISGGKRVG